MRQVLLGSVMAALLGVVGCSATSHQARPATPAIAPQVVVMNITSSAVDDPHAVTMALQLAGHALDDGRQVVLFFNVRGVTVPTTSLPENLAFHDKPIKQLLSNLLARGAEAHVCPHCMKALGLDAADLIPGAFVTNRDRLFSKLGYNTVVFTY